MTNFEENNDRLIITHTRGNDLAFTIDIVEDEVDKDLTGYTASMVFKVNENSPIALELTDGAGLTLTTGLITVSATAAQTNIADGAYYFDLTLTNSGVVTTWLTGILNIKSSWQ